MMFYWFMHWQEKRLQKKILVLQHDRASNQVPQSAIDQEIRYLSLLANFYHKHLKSKHYPFALEMQENAYRNAGQLGDTKALLWLGNSLLNHARAREIWQNDKVLANQDNQIKCQDLFFQAHAFLQEAAKKSIEAQRLLGLSHIHGWGVAIDRKKGFSLIVDSINREDSWDKLPEIFSKTGLNKPEFLKELIKFRTQGPE